LIETFKDLHRKRTTEELKRHPPNIREIISISVMRCHFEIYGNFPNQTLHCSAKLYNTQHGLSWFKQTRKDKLQRESGKIFVAASKTLFLWKCP